MGTALLAYFLDEETAAELARPEGIPAKDLHITVAYLPEVNRDHFVLLQKLAQEVTEKFAGLQAKVNGVGRFYIRDKEEIEDHDVLVMLPDVPGLAEMRIRLLDTLDQRGVEYSIHHGYQPHISLENVSVAEALTLTPAYKVLSFDLNTLTLVFSPDEGEELRITYPHVGENKFMKRRTPKGDDTWKSLLWSKMNFNQRMQALDEAFEEMFGDTGFWVAQVFDDYVLTMSWDETGVIRKYTYTILEDRDIVFGQRYAQGSLEFVPDEEQPVFPLKLTQEQAKKSIRLGLQTLGNVRQANSLKTLDLTDTEWRVGNYLVLWGGKDLTGEFFTPKTDFSSEYTKTNTVIEDWEHGLQPDGVGPTKDEPLGKVLWETAKADDVGLFVERVLNRQNDYLEALRQLDEAGLIVLGTSSEAVPDLVEKDYDGEIVRWGLRRDALTVTPAEPRMLADNRLNKNFSKNVQRFLNSVVLGRFDDRSDEMALRLRLKKKKQMENVL